MRCIETASIGRNWCAKSLILLNLKSHHRRMCAGQATTNANETQRGLPHTSTASSKGYITLYRTGTQNSTTGTTNCSLFHDSTNMTHPQDMYTLCNTNSRTRAHCHHYPPPHTPECTQQHPFSRLENYTYNSRILCTLALNGRRSNMKQKIILASNYLPSKHQRSQMLLP